MAEDKKDLKPEEQSGPAVSGNPAPRKEGPPAQEVKTSAPVQEAEKADTPAPADKSRPDQAEGRKGSSVGGRPQPERTEGQAGTGASEEIRDSQD